MGWVSQRGCPQTLMEWASPGRRSEMPCLQGLPGASSEMPVDKGAPGTPSQTLARQASERRLMS